MRRCVYLDGSHHTWAFTLHSCSDDLQALLIFAEAGIAPQPSPPSPPTALSSGCGCDGLAVGQRVTLSPTYATYGPAVNSSGTIVCGKARRGRRSSRAEAR